MKEQTRTEQHQRREEDRATSMKTRTSEIYQGKLVKRMHLARRLYKLCCSITDYSLMMDTVGPKSFNMILVVTHSRTGWSLIE